MKVKLKHDGCFWISKGQSCRKWNGFIFHCSKVQRQNGKFWHNIRTTNLEQLVLSKKRKWFASENSEVPLSMKCFKKKKAFMTIYGRFCRKNSHISSTKQWFSVWLLKILILGPHPRESDLIGPQWSLDSRIFKIPPPDSNIQSDKKPQG